MPSSMHILSLKFASFFQPNLTLKKKFLKSLKKKVL